MVVLSNNSLPNLLLLIPAPFTFAPSSLQNSFITEFVLKLRPVIVRDYVRHDVNLRPLIEKMALEALLLEHGNTTWDASEVLARVRIGCALF